MNQSFLKYNVGRSGRTNCSALLLLIGEKMSIKNIHASGEDYLETILMLQKKSGMVRSVDLARHTGFSKQSISHAVDVLKDGGFLTKKRKI